jgi:hypothetical protein
MYPQKRDNKSYKHNRIRIECAMQMWGIDRSGNHDHENFWKSMVKSIRDTKRSEVKPVPANCPSIKLPTDTLDALEEVFLQELGEMLQSS